MNKNLKKYLISGKCRKIREEEVDIVAKKYINTKCEIALEELIYYFKDVIEYTIYVKMKISNISDVDFLYQDGIIGLLMSLEKYDTKKRFEPYAKTYISKYITNSCKESIYNKGNLTRYENDLLYKIDEDDCDINKERLKNLSNTSSYSKVVDINEEESESIISYIASNVDEYSINNIKDILNDCDYNILLALYYGYKQNEIAKQLEISNQAINKRIKRIKSKVEDYIRQ